MQGVLTNMMTVKMSFVSEAIALKRPSFCFVQMQPAVPLIPPSSESQRTDVSTVTSTAESSHLAAYRYMHTPRTLAYPLLRSPLNGRRLHNPVVDQNQWITPGHGQPSAPEFASPQRPNTEPNVSTSTQSGWRIVDFLITVGVSILVALIVANRSNRSPAPKAAVPQASSLVASPRQNGLGVGGSLHESIESLSTHSADSTNRSGLVDPTAAVHEGGDDGKLWKQKQPSVFSRIYPAREDRKEGTGMTQ